MPNTNDVTRHVQFLKDAFDRDGFDVKLLDNPLTPGRTSEYLEYQGKIGITALSRSAKNGKTGEPKRVYYVEGDAYQMGFLMGMMAEPEVSRMTTDFVQNIIFDFFNPEEMVKHKDSSLIESVRAVIIDILYEISKSMQPDIPIDCLRELSGIYDGSLTANPKSGVTWDGLWALNFGVDCLLAHIYTGKIFQDYKIPAFFLRVPMFCNAYSLSGALAGNRHYFGRDFMFPTADVFQDTACLIIYRPDDLGGKNRLPLISQTAPGFVGAMAAMNQQGLGIGVDMNPSSLCDPARPGFNSLGLIRECLHHSSTLDDAVAYVTEAQRGVSWFYPVADGKSGKGCIIEAGKKIDDDSFPYLDGVTKRYLKYLPTVEFIQQMQRKYGTPPPQKGLLVRRDDYPFASEYLDYNKGLYKAFNRDLEMKLFYPIVAYDSQAFTPNGFVNPTYDDQNCPAGFYFAPPREERDRMVLVTNHAITPEMRLTSMNHWVAVIASGDINDIQWRYDALHFQLKNLLDPIQKGQRGPLTEPEAWELINFLSPDPDGYYPLYYNREGTKDWRMIQVEGSISLCELQSRKMTSLFGYYGDQPVTIHLLNYLD